MTDAQTLIQGLRFDGGASAEAIAECEKKRQIKLPEDYVQFVKVADGAEGFINDTAYLALWKIGDLYSLNHSYRVEEYVPGCLLFGSDGGGEALAFDTRVAPFAVVQIPFIGMEWKEARVLGRSFSEFLKNLGSRDAGL